MSTENTYVVYLTSGERGQWHTATVHAASADDAKQQADRLRPGWRCYGVQLTLDEPMPTGRA